MAGFYEIRPLPYAEAGYGFPESGQTVVNVTNGKIIRLLVEDEPFDLRYGELRQHERVLDFRDGVLRRNVEWVSPTGRVVRVSSTRLVSFTQRAVAAILYEVEALEEAFPVVALSELVTNESIPLGESDPRAAAALKAPLESDDFQSYEDRAVIVHTTRGSRLTMAAAMDHVIDGPANIEKYVEAHPDTARLTITADVKPGSPLRIVKFLAYGWSSQRSVPAVRDQVGAALGGGGEGGGGGGEGGERDPPPRRVGRVDTRAARAPR
jgi:alpha,alpha-trehalose phosphorylase